MKGTGIEVKELGIEVKGAGIDVKGAGTEVKGAGREMKEGEGNNGKRTSWPIPSSDRGKDIITRLGTETVPRGEAEHRTFRAGSAQTYIIEGLVFRVLEEGEHGLLLSNNQ